ncbi:MAG: ribokinase [Planctomycetota bacterium]|nr:ribokinase [Planctomycetota bacterium]
MDPKPNILVVGSLNMDLVVRAAAMPKPGQTVLGERFVTAPGGKGANQAVAAARLGGHCAMIGRVGDDAFGLQLLDALGEEGVECTGVAATREAATGVALILVDRCGENSIVVAPGANALLTPDDIYSRCDLFDRAQVVVIQLEIPLPTVRAATTAARRHTRTLVLDPAPAPAAMPAELFQVDVLTPNAREAESITGQLAIEERVDKNVALDLIARGAQAAVLKLGPRGSLVVTADGQFARIPPYNVAVVDTTGAGDAFTAALAVGVARGSPLPEAALFATAAGALTCTRLGAQTAMPTVDEVRILMEDQPRGKGGGQ